MKTANKTMNSTNQPVFEVTRGDRVESIHYGSAAVVDAAGRLIAWFGDPHMVTFLRSSAKPFQALPFVTRGGPAAFNLTPRELSLMCASHSGTDEHVTVAESIQVKTGVTEAELLCGVHYPLHEPTAEALRATYERRLAAAGRGPITTEIAPAGPFYYAEEYHQQYLHRVPNGYCGLGGTGVDCPAVPDPLDATAV